MTVHEPVDAGKQNRGRDVSSNSVDFKRNIIRANRRIVSVGNDSVNEVYSDSGGCTRDTLVVDLEKFLGVVSRRVVPLIAPELCQNLIDFDGVVRDGVINVLDGRDSLLGGRKRASNGS